MFHVYSVQYTQKNNIINHTSKDFLSVNSSHHLFNIKKSVYCTSSKLFHLSDLTLQRTKTHFFPKFKTYILLCICTLYTILHYIMLYKTVNVLYTLPVHNSRQNGTLQNMMICLKYKTTKCTDVTEA